MTDDDVIAMEALIRKVQQQEETITQLVEIVAATNRKLTEIARNQFQLDKKYYSMTP